MPPTTPLASFATPGQKPTIQNVGQLLASDKIKKVVILLGAGASTSAGIPDFRSPETGLYANLARFELPYPEAIFELGFFQRTPQPFFQLAKELYPGKYRPTLTHYFFRLLEEKGKLLRVFTQNIDLLDRLAGVSADKIVEAHGSFASSRCLKCKKEVDEKWIKEKCELGEVAYCPDAKCRKKHGETGALVKPDIVFFGEGLPERFFQRLSDLKEADLLITMGTSLQVQPFASLIDYVNPKCPRLLVNLDKVGAIGSEDDDDGGGSFSSFFASRFRESGFDFDGLAVGKGNEDKIRDVFYQGKTDEGARLLARECGWEGRLDELYEERYKYGPQDEVGDAKGKEAKKEAAPLDGAKAEADQVAKEVSSAAKASSDDSKVPGPAEATTKRQEHEEEGDRLADEVAAKLNVDRKGGNAKDETDDKKSSL